LSHVGPVLSIGLQARRLGFRVRRSWPAQARVLPGRRAASPL